MYHTPNLTGIRKAILPKRINEGWGLQHMKLYGVDDEIIMSGYEPPLFAFVLSHPLTAAQSKPLQRLLHQQARPLPSDILKGYNRLFCQSLRSSLQHKLPSSALSQCPRRLHPRLAYNKCTACTSL